MPHEQLTSQCSMSRTVHENEVNVASTLSGIQVAGISAG